MLREHLGYLAIATRCGCAFEANPLYQEALDRAGWIDERWQTRRTPDPAALEGFANQWQELAIYESQDPLRILMACQAAIAELAAAPEGHGSVPAPFGQGDGVWHASGGKGDMCTNPDAGSQGIATGADSTCASTLPPDTLPSDTVPPEATPFAPGAAPEPGGSWPVIPRALHLSLLHEAWPHRAAIVPERTLEWFCDLLNRNIVHQKMPPDVAVIFSVLSLHLGIFFFHDPRYHDLASAFAHSAAAGDDRSAQVAFALRKLLTVASTPENEGRNG